MGGIKNKSLLNKAINKVPLWLKGNVRRQSDKGIVLTKYLGIACLSLAILSTLVLNIVSSYSSSKVNSNAEPVGNPSVLANDSTCDPNNTNAASCISMSISSHSATGDTNDGNLSLSIPQGGGLVAGRHTVSVKSNNINGYQLSVEAISGIEGNTYDLLRSVNLEFVHNDGSVDKEHTIPSLTQNNDKNVNYGNTMPIENNTWGIAIPGSSLYGSSYDDVSVYESYITNPRRIAKAEAAPKFAGMYTYDPYSLSTRGVIIDNSYTLDETSTATPADGNSLAVYYGVRVDHPEQLLAGNYQAEVVYTATVNLPPTPTNLSVSPTTYEFGSCNDSLITIKGTNLSSAYEVYLQKSGTSDEANRLACTNLNLDSTNNQLTCNIPTSRDEVELNTTYDIYVISQAASPGVLKNAFTYTEPATGLSVKSDNENIIVDYDTNMIPVKYVDYDGNGGGYWQVVTDQEIEENTNNWFRYGETPEDKRWANAITVTAETRESYRKKQTGEDPDPRILPSDNPSGNGEANPEILGYWVYIPRYAYEVQRRDATDKNVDPQNFDIVFETTNDTVKTPAKCTLNTAEKLTADINSSILYQDCIKQLYGDKGLEYPGNDEDLSNGQTTWATHPAFSWGDTELNGIWVGKFEMTGTRTAPTVKPNQHANISEYIGNFYSMARSIGKEDKCNVGGDTIGGIEQNSHNLQTTKSHMLKNSEWGAITYLAHSKYGAGINTSISYDTNIQRNSAYPSSSADADGTSSRYGVTGCGPAEANETSSRSTYPDGTALSADVIESPIACSQDLTRAYNGSLGVLSSTTNAVYGVYGLSGGAGEYVMGNRTASDTQTTTTDTKYFETPANATYVDLYVATPNGPFGTEPSWSLSNNEAWYNYDICTFETCGGTATYETITAQSASSNDQSWGGAYSNFVYDNDPWFRRGSYSYNIYASPFCINGDDGGYYVGTGSRAALLALPAGQ